MHHRQGLRPAHPAQPGGRGTRHPSYQSRTGEALCRGLVESGVDVVDIGLVGTEEVYFAVFSLGLDGGVMVTASHNPKDYNGMKFTRDKARPISADTGLLDMEAAVMEALASGGLRAQGAAP